MEMTELTEKIQQWVRDRNLQTQDPRIQAVKTMEELGELSRALLKSNTTEIVDSIGDITVTLIAMSMQLRLDFTECVQSAYDEIKNRRGELRDGVFMKESDLKEFYGA